MLLSQPEVACQAVGPAVAKRSRYGPCPGFSVEVCKPNDLPPPITTHTQKETFLNDSECCWLSNIVLL